MALAISAVGGLIKILSVETSSRFERGNRRDLKMVQPGGAQAPDPQSVVRVAAQQVADRVQNDPAFVAQLVADPRATLEAQGIPADAVNDVIGAAGGLPKGDPNAAKPRCMLSIGCVTTQCCLSISVCCFSGSC